MIILLGHMLFPDHSGLPLRQMPIFMAEDAGFCRRYRYHKHKLILVLAAMRHHRDRLIAQGYTVEYWPLTAETAALSYEEKLARSLQKYSATTLHTYEIEDHDTRDRLEQFCQAQSLPLHTYDSPLFLTSHREFADYRQRYKRLFMADFYKIQRRRLNILLDDNGEPVGDRWSYDDQNREALPQSMSVPDVALPEPTHHVQAISTLIDEQFPDNPGNSAQFWLPVTRDAALDWLQNFLRDRFSAFGPYEDALTSRSPFVFHSVLSPMLNLGLLTPREVIDAALDYAAAHGEVPLNSLEGFVRQIIGWREYIRGVYHTMGREQRRSNHWQHTRQLTADWYQGTTGLVPVDQVIERVNAQGYAHHIERLMVMSNAMLLAEVHPDAVFRWFMELFVDSADWVMVPNVYGMGQFADGGKMMTKPYTSGSNYLRKMGDYRKGDWCDVWDGLYWRFVDQKQAQLQKNPRLAMMVKTLNRMKPDRKATIFDAAAQFIEQYTVIAG